MKKYVLINKKLLALYGIVACSSALLGMSFAYVMAALVDLISNPSWDYFYKIVLLSLGWLIADIFMEFLFGHLKNIYLNKVTVQLRQDIFEHIIHQKPGQFMQTKKGKYLADLNNNIKDLEEYFFDPILSSVYSLANFFGAFIGMLLIDLNTIFLIVFMVIISTIIPSFAAKHIQKRSSEFLNSQDKYQSKLREFLGGVLVIQSFHLFSHINQQHWSYNKNMETKRQKHRDLNITIYCASAFCGLLATITAMLFGAFLVLQGKANAGVIVTMGHLIGNITSVSDTITQFLSQMNASKPIRERFHEILNWLPFEQDDRKKLSQIDNISFQNLSFYYSDNKNSTDKNYVLRNISTKLELGKSYAIVGKSGCGKSTFLNLLQGYYDDYTGDILINNKNMKLFSPESIAVQIGQIQQSIFVFDDTIRNNITLYQPFSDKEIYEAISKAGLNNFVENLPQKLDSVITEDGENLSGGERQRIAIARLILHNSQVFLLDEFTSNLDLQTSLAIENNILTLQDKIIINVTHKIIPELLKKYDEILVMNEGEIIERGSYHDLVDNKGYFFSLTCLS